MGIADAILDLVSSGTTLRENNLKEIEGGVVLESQVSWKHAMLYAFECYWKRVSSSCFYVLALLNLFLY